MSDDEEAQPRSLVGRDITNEEPDDDYGQEPRARDYEDAPADDREDASDGAPAEALSRAADDRDEAAPRDAAPAADDDHKEMLDRWIDAKRARDFVTADRLREQLRAQGIEPDAARPSPRVAATYGKGARLDAQTEAKLDEWVAAKRSRDFATADRIRDEMRARGIEPEAARPPGHSAGGGYPPPLSQSTEAKLDAWVAAKRARDFATSDRLRDELRASGIEPEQVRPVGGPPSRVPPPRYEYPPNGPPPYHGSSNYPPPHQSGYGGGYGGGWGGGGGYGGGGYDDRGGYGGGGGGDHYGGGQYGGGKGYGGPPPYGGYGGPPSSHEYGKGYGPPSGPYGEYHGGYPGGGRDGGYPGGGRDGGTDAKLDAWVSAKRARDFVTADRLREELRAAGVEPEQERPSGAKRQRL